MGNYSKLIATIVGAAISTAVAFGVLPESMGVEIQAAVITIVTSLFTYFAPANTPA